ncbi:hypothetical protein A5886_002704 [Enterococcus sp. 8G7_MSG3316]|uniref:histidine kinase n=1 Tax=Candidatus Enterococcus testudinis TaxID=1834191 RepID=A0A242A999_9ENTE|nr:HAMP domain-containing sensor histidine kinase [Enterococcus sp. 8G7_MSG3316]OTN77604.1 hypothetical protein A5886_002704 [Enterococcus sp. 8G7_MSG3316]
MKTNQKALRRNTAQFQLTRQFSLLLGAVMLFFNLVFILLSIGYLYERLADQADQVFETIEKGHAAKSGWPAVIDVYVSADEESALRVRQADGQVYNSEEATEVFPALATGKIIPLLEGIVLSEEDVYYTKTEEINGDQVTIALNSEASVELAYGLLWISSLLNLAAVVIGSLLIYWRVGKWSQKLTSMAKEITAIESGKSGELTVVREPVEIQSVAISFNQLLKEQRETIAREKRFIADASHELRTPLAAIRGHVKLIQRRSAAHPEVIPASLEFIDKESKRLEILSNQLLDLEKQPMTKQTQTLDVGQLIREVCEKQAIVSTQAIDYVIEEPLMMKGVKTDFQQMVQNLLENAAKYAPAETMIHVHFGQKDQHIYLSVADQGIGIPDDKKDRIFDRFYRVEDSRSSEINGSGIGLSLVKQIADQYQATITVADNQPKGSVFVVDFSKNHLI